MLSISSMTKEGFFTQPMRMVDRRAIKGIITLLENGGQEGDKGHHHAVAHIVHDIQKLSGGSVWQLSFKIEQAVAQGDHGGSRQVNDRQGNDGLFAFGMEDLYTVGRDGFQHGDAHSWP